MARLRSLPLAILGALLALAVPITSGGLAAVWSLGLIHPDPNGPLVLAVQSMALPGLAVTPAGLALAAWAAGIRGRLAWLALALWGIPILGVLWFIAVASLGGLAGEPF